MNLARRIGPANDGKKLTTNIQPVIPFDISENWNLITRTIMPASLQGGLAYWAASPDAGPRAFGSDFRRTSDVAVTQQVD